MSWLKDSLKSAVTDSRLGSAVAKAHNAASSALAAAVAASPVVARVATAAQDRLLGRTELAVAVRRAARLLFVLLRDAAAR